MFIVTPFLPICSHLANHADGAQLLRPHNYGTRVTHRRVIRPWLCSGQPGTWSCGHIPSGRRITREAESGAGQFLHAPAGTAPTKVANWRSSALVAPLRQSSAIDRDVGSGKMSSSPISTPSRIARATGSGEAFGTSRPRDISVSTGPAQDGVDAYPLSGQKGTEGLC